MSPRFPHSGLYTVGDHRLSAGDIVDLVAPYLTPERQLKIRDVVAKRTCNVAAVLENIYDRGNISAVLRSAEAHGFQSAHVIELGEKFKTANRVTQGADKWVDVQRWKSTVECTRHLKSLGYQIVATHLDARAVPIGEIDFSKPTAIVFGNEKDGISQEMIAEADRTVIIPMQGFVQSFNISVAAAIAFYHAHQDRVLRLGKSGDLSDLEQLALRAEFSLRSSKNPERLLEELVSRKESQGGALGLLFE